jgi:steroid delta-isomerase-like uncharacterized protein
MTECSDSAKKRPLADPGVRQTKKQTKGGIKMAIDMEKLFRKQDEACASHDVGKIMSDYADDCFYENLASGVVKKGKKEISEYFHELFVGIPDVKFETRSVFFSSDQSCWEWVMTGTHSGDLPNLPATGRTISVRGATVAEIRGDKISRVSDYYDRATVLRQLGVIPTASQG